MENIDFSKQLLNKTTMKAIVTTGHGDYDKLSYEDVLIPQLNEDEVLVKVLACGVNNTEINTRLGWYSETVDKGTNNFNENKHEIKEKGGWQGSTPFPLIQGTDCCGIVVKAGNNVKNSNDLLNNRVLIRCCQRVDGFNSFKTVWMASDFNGAFAEYVKVRASEVFVVKSSWSDVELGSIPCAYGSAENMVHRANIKNNEKVLIVGASGGVGSALVQLVKRRGALVEGITSKGKMKQVLDIGCVNVYSREDKLIEKLGEEYYDAVMDNVGGSTFPLMLKLLKRGGRFVTSGAIGGPNVSLDLRDLYLKDITLIGCTMWDEPVFPNLISYIEKNEIKPLIAKVYKLKDIEEAQKEFLKKTHIGKIVLTPE